MPFWLPPTVLLGIFVYGGILWNFIISLTDFAGIVRPEYAVGNFDFEMYAQMLQDPAFWDAATNTIVLLLVFTVLCLIVGLALAIVVDNVLKWQGVFRTILLLPFSLSFVVTAVFWQWMYNPEIGVINTIFRAIGLDVLALNWIGNPSLKLYSVIIALVWQFSGYAMIIYLANLRTIPDAHYEAARIDGSGFFTMYRKVIIPQLSSAAVSSAVVLMVFSLKAFTWLFVVFGRNPGPSADILGVMMYRQAFAANQWAYGAALGTVLFTMTIVILAPYLYWQYQRGEL
ncbi:carbohydrate ABC transporter permease [Halopenitus sp. H-Gu1]|uniref:carbohydrate ABC transporter permease n=1 Tax=Halopenitus sp. H-Gu1 TaxID=3242697 RepID=UPI00359D72F7